MMNRREHKELKEPARCTIHCSPFTIHALVGTGTFLLGFQPRLEPHG